MTDHSRSTPLPKLGAAALITLAVLLFTFCLESFGVIAPFRLKTLDLLFRHVPLAKASPEVVVVPDWVAMQLRRDSVRNLAELDALESGGAGYRPAASFRSRYLHEGLYTMVDPALQADLWQG